MKGQIVLGLIVAAAILVATGGYIYFSPYQSCMRNYRERFAAEGKDIEEYILTQSCMRQMGGN